MHTAYRTFLESPWTWPGMVTGGMVAGDSFSAEPIPMFQLAAECPQILRKSSKSRIKSHNFIPLDSSSF